jgi:hypothetical protein
MSLLFPDPTQPAFPLAEQIQWDLQGDKGAADRLRGVGLQVMEQLKRENVNDYPIYRLGPFEYPGGVRVRVFRQKQIFVDLYIVSIYAPPSEQPKQVEDRELIPELEKGQFYWVPGCVARYDAVKDSKNCIPSGPLAGESVSAAGNASGATSVLAYRCIDFGLPTPGASPDGSIVRNYHAVVLPGNSVDTAMADIDSGLTFSADHIPTSGPFSLSCIVKLNSPVKVDYSFTEKTNELNDGFTNYNIFKPRFLTSADGESWSSLCPGSLAPLIGCLEISRFSDHWVKITPPWPPYNDNFVDNAVHAIGYREIGTICADEPLLTSDYDAASPYWDKVTTGELEALSGEFDGGWAENTETANTTPYASYCRFKVLGSHVKPVGTRAIRALDGGEKRYSTVYSCSYDEGTDTTSFVLKDYQHKLYMTESDGEASIIFGQQPFPVCHPQGYMVGMNLLGMCWFNGNRILAGKVCDFQGEYALPPTMSDPLEIGEWYHVCMTYDEEGKTNLYTTKLGVRTINVKSFLQSTSVFIPDKDLKFYSGIEMWNNAPSVTAPSSEWRAAWVYSAAMDIGLPRFYFHALSDDEVRALLLESFHGVFVADDYEAAQLIGAGLTPVTL